MDLPVLERLKSLHSTESPKGLEALIEDISQSDDNKLHSTTEGTRSDSKKNNAEQVEEEEDATPKLHEKAKEFLVENPIDVYNSKVFVGNISYKVREREFREFFEYFGKVVRVQILKDKKTRRSRGIGFVTFSSPLDAKHALNAEVHELTLDGRFMKVQWAERKKTVQARKQQEALEREKKVNELQDAVSQFSQPQKSTPIEERSVSIPWDDKSLVNKLNDDSLALIFALLPFKERIRIERVCKRWAAVSRQSWVHIDHLDFTGAFKAFTGTGGLTDRILISVLKRTIGLKSLDVSASPYMLTSFGLQSIGDYCKDLHYLNLSRTAVGSSCLKRISSECQKLKVVILERCQELGEKGLWWLLKNNEQIEYLAVTDSVRITGQCFHFLRSALHTLNLTNSTKISDTALSHLSEACGTTVRNINISGCKAVTSSGLSLFFQRCSQLQKLEICQTPYVDCLEGLKDLRHLTQLTSLSLSTNEYAHDAVLQGLSEGCQNLRSLKIEACHNLTLEGLEYLTRLNNLEVLNVSYLTEMCNDVVSRIAANGKLRIFIARACTRLSDDAILSLLLSCDRLEEADFSSCYLVKDTLLTDEIFNKTVLDESECTSKVKLYVGLTSISKDALRQHEMKDSRYVLVDECRTVGMLRNDRDPTACAPFYPSDSEEDEFEMNWKSTEPELNGGECVDVAEDFLVNDDPTVLEDLNEEEFYLT